MLKHPTKTVKSLQNHHPPIIRFHFLPTSLRHTNLLSVLRKFTVSPSPASPLGLFHKLVVLPHVSLSSSFAYPLAWITFLHALCMSVNKHTSGNPLPPGAFWEQPLPGGLAYHLLSSDSCPGAMLLRLIVCPMPTLMCKLQGKRCWVSNSEYSLFSLPRTCYLLTKCILIVRK